MATNLKKELNFFEMLLVRTGTFVKGSFLNHTFWALVSPKHWAKVTKIKIWPITVIWIEHRSASEQFWLAVSPPSIFIKSRWALLVPQLTLPLVPAQIKKITHPIQLNFNLKSTYSSWRSSFDIPFLSSTTPSTVLFCSGLLTLINRSILEFHM